MKRTRRAIEIALAHYARKGRRSCGRVDRNEATALSGEASYRANVLITRGRCQEIRKRTIQHAKANDQFWARSLEIARNRTNRGGLVRLGTLRRACIPKYAKNYMVPLRLVCRRQKNPHGTCGA